MDILELNYNIPFAVNETIDFDFVIICHSITIFVHVIHSVGIQLPTYLSNAILKTAYSCWEMCI